jgi:GNAT superfamily N-acetyltransferase
MTEPRLEPNLRLADPEESEAIARLINAAFVVERFFIDRERTNPEKVRDLMGKGKFLLAEDGQRLTGCVYLELRGERGYLGLLAVEPSLQKSGIGRLLVKAAEDRFRDAGCEAVDLRTVNLRAELPGFYRKLGYVETGTDPFVGDAEPNMPCYFVNMSKQLM